MEAVAVTLSAPDDDWRRFLVPASQLEGRDRRRRLGTGVAALDADLRGGWPAAALSEIVGGRSAGRTSILYASLAAALDTGPGVALVDAAGALDPRAAEHAGVALPLLLWVRAAGGRALAAADLLVAAGGFRLVAVDLGDHPPRVPGAAWLRLKRAAERQGTAVLVTAPRRVIGTAAATAVVLRDARPRFAAAGGPLLVALETRACIERSLGAASGPDPAHRRRLRFDSSR